MDSDFTDLDVCLAQCTNPLNEMSDELIERLCSITVEQPNGPYTTLRFLAYKAQSPQEKEALHALKVLEKVVKQGGYKIADEVGKFRFLNEIIKIVSPKYLAHRTSENVRNRIVELIFMWSMEFKEMPKIFEAYQMLKVQKIVSEDPVHVLENFQPPTPPLPRPKDEIFDDEKTVKTLKSLLTSGRPDQLESANRLIKNLAMKAEMRVQFKANFNTELESIENCAQLLCDMLAQSNLNLQIDSSQKTIVYKGATDEDIELMRELFSNCEKSRIKLFKFANQISDKDSTELNRLIEVAELLTSSINASKRYFALLNNPNLITLTKNNTNTPIGSHFTNNNSDPTVSANCEERLLDLNSSPSSSPILLCLEHNSTLSNMDLLNCNGNSDCILNSNLLDYKDCITNSSLKSSSSSSSHNISLAELSQSNCKDKSSGKKKFKTAMEELDALSEMLIKQHLNKSPAEKSLNLSEANVSQLNLNESRCLSPYDSPSSMGNESSNPSNSTNLTNLLANLYIPYDSIKPCPEVQSPLIVFNKNGLMITLHFTGNRPHKQILVFVLTFTNHNSFPVSNIQFLAAVPKDMKVKLQSQTATSLPKLESNKNLPDKFITQVMLIAFNDVAMIGGNGDEEQDSSGTTTVNQRTANSQNERYKFRLKFKFSYLINDTPVEHVSYFDWSLGDNILHSQSSPN